MVKPKKDSEFIKIYQSFKALVTQEEVCKEIETGKVTDTLIKCFYQKASELMDHLNNTFPNLLCKPAQNLQMGPETS
jgi:hypothetical protein